MKHIKKSWVSPVKSMQTFMPQEYCANCYRYCCDCESYVNSLGTYYTYAGSIPYGTTSPHWTGDTFQEGTAGPKHYGPNSSNIPSGEYICHTSNQTLSPATIENLYEIWNTYINGTIDSPYGANTPVETGVTFTPYPTDLPYYSQILVTFTDSHGKLHYGRMERIPGNTWNHS